MLNFGLISRAYLPLIEQQLLIVSGLLLYREPLTCLRNRDPLGCLLIDDFGVIARLIVRRTLLAAGARITLQFDCDVAAGASHPSLGSGTHGEED